MKGFKSVGLVALTLGVMLLSMCCMAAPEAAACDQVQAIVAGHCQQQLVQQVVVPQYQYAQQLQLQVVQPQYLQQAVVLRQQLHVPRQQIVVQQVRAHKPQQLRLQLRQSVTRTRTVIRG